jgi:hypothetical protein
MRPAIAMIELIFAIVIIAISVMTIPSMMNIAGASTKRMTIDDDVLSRLSSQMVDKFQGRWGGEYSTVGGEDNTSGYMKISTISTVSDLNCSRIVGAFYYRINLDSNASCLIAQNPSVIPNLGSGDVSNGLEQLNGGTETLSVVSSTGETFDINATYNVRYVDANVTPNNYSSNTVTATWKLGSSGTIGADNGGSKGTPTHLKRVVVNFWNRALDVNTTLTFFKSNKGNN